MLLLLLGGSGAGGGGSAWPPVIARPGQVSNAELVESATRSSLAASGNSTTLVKSITSEEG